MVWERTAFPDHFFTQEIAMKIVTFQYNKDDSALLHTKTHADELLRSKQAIPNRFTAFGYTDRFLWEEAASLRQQPTKEFAIPGNWQ
jgi:hypothetical protein